MDNNRLQTVLVVLSVFLILLISLELVFYFRLTKNKKSGASNLGQKKIVLPLMWSKKGKKLKIKVVINKRYLQKIVPLNHRIFLLNLQHSLILR